MKKFDNIFEQAREIIRQQWTLQDLRREAQCAGKPSAPAGPKRSASRSPPPGSASSVPAAATSSTPDTKPDALVGPHRTKRPYPTAQHSAGHITKHEKRFTP